MPNPHSGLTIDLNDVVARATERIDRTALMTKRAEGAAVRSTFPAED